MVNLGILFCRAGGWLDRIINYQANRIGKIVLNACNGVCFCDVKRPHIGQALENMQHEGYRAAR